MQSGNLPNNIFANMPRKPPTSPSSNNNENRPINPSSNPNPPKNTTADDIPPPKQEKKRPSKGRISSMFKQKQIDNYFIDLLRWIRDDKYCLRVKGQILGSIALKKWVREGLDSFRRDKFKEEEYQKEYRKSSFLNLTPDQLGFSKATLSKNASSQKIDLILFKIIEIMSAQLETNSWMVVKIIRRYLRQGKFFPSLYESQIGNQVFRPNARAIQRFFMGSDQKTINQTYREFQELLARCMELFYEEYQKCILSIAQFLQVKLSERNSRPLGMVLWDSYCHLSDMLLRREVEEGQQIRYELREARKKCREYVLVKKIKIFMFLVKLFHKAISTDQNLIEEVAAIRQNFKETTMTKVDQNIIEVEKSDRFSALDVNELTRHLTELLLALFPWRQFQQKKNNDRLIKIINKTQSLPFKPIKMILGEIKKQTFEEIDEEVRRGNWPVHNCQWKKWLGLFLYKYRSFKKKNKIALNKYPLLLRQTIWLSKQVMKEEYIDFWKVVDHHHPQLRSDINHQQPVVRIEAHLEQIYFLVKQILDAKDQYRDDVSVTDLLPIFTASLGYLRQKKIREFCSFFKIDNFSTLITDHITETLNIEEKQPERPTRIIYSIEEKDKNIEQQLKLLCKMVELSTSELNFLQNFVSGSETNGLSLVVLLCKMFKKIQPESTHDVKCLRYIIKTLDAIFCNRETRILLPIALGVVESGKSSCSKVIKQIVDICVQIEGSSQFARQCKKLRSTFTTHIYNILQMSNSLDQYFPSGSRRQDEKLYERLEKYLKEQRTQQISQLFFNVQNPPLKAVPWLYHYLMILESSSLTMLEIQIVRELVFKLRIHKQAERQYPNMEVVVEIMNKGKIHQVIADILKPSMRNNQKEQGDSLNLGNQKYQGFIARQDHPQSIQKNHNPKYSSKHYRTNKIKKQNNEDQRQIYGQICSSLRLIQTILKLNIEGKFYLLQNLKLNSWLLTSLTGSGHFYTVQFTVKLEERKVQPETERKNSKSLQRQKPEVKIVQQQLKASVNLIHTITNLINFQKRYNINLADHPSNRLKPSGIIYFDSSFAEESGVIFANIVHKAQQNMLSEDITHGTITISVLEILQHLIIMGFEKQTFFSMTNRNYPMNKISNSHAATNNLLNQFFNLILNILSVNDTDVREKQICLEFLIVCLKGYKFSQFVRAKVLKYTQPFESCINMLDEEGGIAMTVRLLMFFNLLLSDQPSIDDLRFVKYCLVDVFRFGNRIALLSRNILRKQRIQVPFSSAIELNLIWSQKIKDAFMCKNILLLYLAILSAMLTTQQAYIAQQTCRWILEEVDLFMTPVESLPIYSLNELGEDITRKILKQVDQQLEKGYLQFTQQLHQKLLYGLQGSFGEDYVCRRWEVYHQSVQNQQNATDNVIKAFQINLQYSLQKSQEMLSQFYCTILLGLLQRGMYGYYFHKGELTHSKKFTQAISRNERSPNNISGIQIFYKTQQILTKCFILIRYITDDVWDNMTDGTVFFSKNSAVVLLGEVLKFIAKMFLESGNSSANFTADTGRVIDRLEAYLSSSSRERVGEEALTVMVGGEMELLQALYILSPLRNISEGGFNFNNNMFLESIRSYFTSIDQILTNSFSKMHPLSILKLQHLIYHQELTNLLALESQQRAFQNYVSIYERRQILQKLFKGLEMVIQLLNDKEAHDGIKALGIQLFSKVFQIEEIVRGNGIEKYRKLNHQIGAILEKMIIDQGQSQLISGIFIANFTSEATANSPGQWTRFTSKLLSSNNNLILNRMGRCGFLHNLWAIIESKMYFEALLNIDSDDAWRTQQIGRTLTNLFVNIQSHTQKFQENRITPSNQLETDLASRVINQVDEINFQRKFQRNIFSIIAELRLFELLKYFMLFLLSAFKRCPLLHELCQKTIPSGPLNEQSWQRLRVTLEYSCDFLHKFADSIKYGAEHIVAVNNSVCKENIFAGISIRTFFEEYKNDEELIEDALNSILILAECVNTYMNIWKSYDWKSKVDWKLARKSLILKTNQTISKWMELAKKMNCEPLLKKKLSMLSAHISDNNKR